MGVNRVDILPPLRSAVDSQLFVQIFERMYVCMYVCYEVVLYTDDVQLLYLIDRPVYLLPD